MPPTLKIEQTFKGLVCGIDEVGRGPLAGPVIACSAIIKPTALSHPSVNLINDSKKISAKKRQKICSDIDDIAIYSLGQATVEDIDTHNIFQATFLAMRRAYTNLCEQLDTPPIAALIDGKFTPNLPCQCLPVIKGDQKSLSIATASIIAKEHRDNLMHNLSRAHPHYGWENNAGYGTKQHIQAINTHGITPHHRKSFKPISEVLSTTY